MQVLSIIVPYIKSTSNIWVSSRTLHDWLSNNGFPIKTSRADICPGNLSLYKLLDYPNLDQWTINEFDYAIKTDDYNHLLSLLRGGANIEAQNYDERTALIWAARYGKVKCLKLLLDHKANIEAKTKYGHTALSWAAEKGEADCLKLLLQRRADIETKDNYGYTSLFWASIHGNVDCLRLLLGDKANIEAKNNDGETALSRAAKWGETECLKILIGGGAQVEPELREEYPQYAELWRDSTL